MEDLGTPVLDNHLHLDPAQGQGLAAVEEFVRLGGTHMLIVNKPSWHLGSEVDEGADFEPVFETTLDIVSEARAILPGKAWAVLGVHPTLISRLVSERGFSPDAAEAVMQAGLDLAADYVRDGHALALKSGRPHYETSDAVAAASDRILRHALTLGADAQCAVQLHTEATEDLRQVADWADERGLAPEKVVKHYAGGELRGVTPSVMSEPDRLQRAAASGAGFLMETDFVDDPDRPGAVLGPKTVPRRVRWLVEEGHEEAVHRAHVETPAAVYEIDTTATLTG